MNNWITISSCCESLQPWRHHSNQTTVQLDQLHEYLYCSLLRILINSFGLSCAYTRLESIGRNSLQDHEIPNLPELQRLVKQFKNKYFLFCSKWLSVHFTWSWTILPTSCARIWGLWQPVLGFLLQKLLLACLYARRPQHRHGSAILVYTCSRWSI